MAKIEINLRVQNPQEVVEKEKGKLADVFSKMFMDEEKIRREVEKAVGDELIQELKNKIPEALAKRGIKAQVDFSFVETKEFRKGEGQ